MSKNIHLLELSNYDNPIVKEDNREEWVEFGEQNDMFEFILDRYNNSTTNNAIINNTSRLIFGRGLGCVDASRKPNEYAAAISLFSKHTVRNLSKDLKVLGQCAVQVIYSKNRKKIARVEHIPVHLLRPEKCDNKGEINGYYFCNDWKDTKKHVPQRIDAFGKSKSDIEILYIKPYSINMKYFALPDWYGGLKYAQLEEEISNYLLTEVTSGFSARAIINMNNGIPDEQSQIAIKNKILNNLTGTDGQKVIVSFNNSSESATSVESLSVNDAPNLYEQLSSECVSKIMLAHNIVSPLMFGIASKNGFGSNSEELESSYILYHNMYVVPMQDLLLDAFNNILAFNDISLPLFFEELQPLTSDGDLAKTDEAEDTLNALNSLSPLVANKVLENMSQDEIRSLVGLRKDDTKLSKQPKRITEEEGEEILSEVEGEPMSEDFEEVDSRAYNEDNSSLDEWIKSNEDKKELSMLEKLASIIKSRPSDPSNLDKSKYKVRYRYSTDSPKSETRDFCSQMMQRTRNGVVYRLEDIDIASRNGVHKELGHKQLAYDLFKFKGGVNCRHYWTEVLYKLKKGKDGKYKEDKALSSSDEVVSIPKSYTPTPTGRQRAKQVEGDRADKGHHPNYGK